MTMKNLSKLEEILTRYEEVKDLLNMLSNLAQDKSDSIDAYANGINLIATLANDNTFQLKELFNDIHQSKETA